MDYKLDVNVLWNKIGDLGEMVEPHEFALVVYDAYGVKDAYSPTGLINEMMKDALQITDGFLKEAIKFALFRMMLHLRKKDDGTDLVPLVARMVDSWNAILQLTEHLEDPDCLAHPAQPDSEASAEESAEESVSAAE